MGVLSKIRDAGFAVSLSGDNFTVAPASQLSELQRGFLKSHKAEIIQGLEQEQAANDSKATGLSQTETDSLRNWLAFISETDKAAIADLLQQCQTDPKALRYFFQRATETPPQNPYPYDDRHLCRECQNLINRRCVASATRYHPVDTHPRRCADFTGAGQ